METDASTAQAGETIGSAKTTILVDLEDEDSANAEKGVEPGRDRYGTAIWYLPSARFPPFSYLSEQKVSEDYACGLIVNRNMDTVLQSDILS